MSLCVRVSASLRSRTLKWENHNCNVLFVSVSWYQLIRVSSASADLLCFSSSGLRRCEVPSGDVPSSYQPRDGQEHHAVSGSQPVSPGGRGPCGAGKDQSWAVLLRRQRWQQGETDKHNMSPSEVETVLLIRLTWALQNRQDASGHHQPENLREPAEPFTLSSTFPPDRISSALSQSTAVCSYIISI